MKYLLFLMLIGCSQIPEDSGSIDVLFCPDVGDIEIYLKNYLENSEKSVCAFYDWDYEVISLDYIDSVVLDHKAPYHQNVVTAPGGHQMHNKFCVLDERVVITGSMNPTVRGMHHNNNNLLIIESEHLAKNYLDEFGELISGTFSGGKKIRYPKIYINKTLIENYFCPEDCTPEIFTDLIYSARESVYFMAFSFTHDDIGQSLIYAHNHGIHVSGVMEKTQNNKWSEYEKLKNAGVDVIWDYNKANMHHKVFIIDEKIVITGSANPSRNGLERNDENILVIHDEEVAHKFMVEYQNLNK